MYNYIQKIRYNNIDTVSFVYFPKFFYLCQKTFIFFLKENIPYIYFNLIKKKYNFNITSTKSKFLYPLQYNNIIKINLKIKKIEKHSILLHYIIYNKSLKKISFKSDIQKTYISLKSKKQKYIQKELIFFLTKFIYIQK